MIGSGFIYLLALAELFKFYGNFEVDFSVYASELDFISLFIEIISSMGVVMMISCQPASE